MLRYATLFLLIATLSFAQTRREFEVASIKPVSGQPVNQVAVGLHIDGSQVRLSYLSLKDYIGVAYRLKLNQITGPDWMGSQRFDISAKLPEGASQSDVPEMLQALLTERFQIKSHRETKDLPVYALGVGKEGLKIQPSDPTGTIADSNGAVNVAAGGNGTGVAINFGGGAYFNLGPNGFEAKRLPFGTFADMLTRFMDRPVVDMTNLKGAYDMTLDLAPEDRTAMLIRSAVNAGVVLPPQALGLLDTASNASLSDAMKKLGLTLEAKRAPMEILVIDQLQKTPTEN
jgi:uncharacterized protein (TIGR03435 family)